MATHADHAIILALRCGEYAVLEDIYARHAPTVSAWVQRNGGLPADAEDVFQEGILALHDKAGDPDFTLTCPLGALLFRICQNKWLYALRKKRTEARVISDLAPQWEVTPSVHDLVEAVEEDDLHRRRLRASFAELSETCRELLQLLARGVPTPEIASRLGMSGPPTVYRRRHACGKRWRERYRHITPTDANAAP